MTKIVAAYIITHTPIYLSQTHTYTHKQTHTHTHTHIDTPVHANTHTTEPISTHTPHIPRVNMRLFQCMSFELWLVITSLISFHERKSDSRDLILYFAPCLFNSKCY